MSGKLRQADRVRLRLMTERDRDRVAALAVDRNLPPSAVLRILQTRYGGDLTAYERDPSNAGLRLPRRRWNRLP